MPARAVPRQKPARSLSVGARGANVPLRRREAPSLSTRVRIAGMQRSRILAAAVEAMDELGYADASVADMVSRSRVSRRTFYDLFANRDECLAGVLEETAARVELELERAGVARLAWRERLREGLWVILTFLEREPVLARVCAVQAFGGGAAVRLQREEILTRLAAAVDMGRFESARGGECSSLTAEGLVGAACMIVSARLSRRETLLDGLPGELLGLILAPYIGQAATRREQSRCTPTTRASAQGSASPAYPAGGDLLHGVPMRLTYRTARVLEGVAQNPGASNRQIADHAGIADPGQISKLLRRLERLGLLENRGGGHAHGEPNQWTLTSTGASVTQNIAGHTQQTSKGSGR